MGTLRLLDASGRPAWSLSGNQGPEWHTATVDLISTSFTFEYRRADGHLGDAAGNGRVTVV